MKINTKKKNIHKSIFYIVTDKNQKAEKSKIAIKWKKNFNGMKIKKMWHKKQFQIEPGNTHKQKILPIMKNEEK